MATLPSGDMDAVWQSLMEKFSSLLWTIPVSKHQFRIFLENVDGIMEDAEVDIVQSVPAGDQRDWLIANPEIGRSMVVSIMEKRKEVL